MKWLSKGWALTLVFAVGILSVTPAIAGTVVDFARNAGHVDGIEAVSSGTPKTKRGERLVATNHAGYLPNYVVQKVPWAESLGGLPPQGFVLKCGTGFGGGEDSGFGTANGVLAGRADVPADVSSNWTTVQGYGFTPHATGYIPKGGTKPGPATNACATTQAMARHVATGVYQVSAFTPAPCSIPQPAIITPMTSQDINATYINVNDPDREGFVQEVHMFDVSGAPVDSEFTIAWLSNPCGPP